MRLRGGMTRQSPITIGEPLPWGRSFNLPFRRRNTLSSLSFLMFGKLSEKLPDRHKETSRNVQTSVIIGQRVAANPPSHSWPCAGTVSNSAAFGGHDASLPRVRDPCIERAVRPGRGHPLATRCEPAGRSASATRAVRYYWGVSDTLAWRPGANRDGSRSIPDDGRMRPGGGRAGK